MGAWTARHVLIVSEHLDRCLNECVDIQTHVCTAIEDPDRCPDIQIGMDDHMGIHTSSMCPEGCLDVSGWVSPSVTSVWKHV